MKNRIYANPTFWALVIVGILILASVALTWWLPGNKASRPTAEPPKVLVSYSEDKNLPTDSAPDKSSHKEPSKKKKRTSKRKKQSSGAKQPSTPSGSPLDHKL